MRIMLCFNKKVGLERRNLPNFSAELLRKKAMEIADDTMLAGHRGVKKTENTNKFLLP